MPPHRPRLLDTCALVLCLLALLPCAGHAGGRPNAAHAGVAGTVTDITLPDGTRQRLLYLAPEHPRATLVMLPGGSGDVGIEPGGQLRHDDNYVVRTRQWWLDHHFAVLIAAPIGHLNLRGRRSTPAYAAVIGQLVDHAKARNPSPVFLFGTSQGAIAAMNGAATLGPTRVAGVILSESVAVLGGSHETVFMARPQDVRVPALIVANRDDACKVAPPSMAPQIAAAMSHSPNVQVLYVQGGVAKGTDACGSLSPHGYDGIEGDVENAIAAWLYRQLEQPADRQPL